MTMHGMFWRFPEAFSLGQTTGIAPRSSYFKVVGYFASGKIASYWAMTTPPVRSFSTSDRPNAWSRNNSIS